MGFLLPALTQAKLDNQRDVVKNERRQTVRQPALRPGRTRRCSRPSIRADHPYHHSVIGSMADLSAASLEDVSAFFRTYYAPNNASLCIAGDFDPAAGEAAGREVLRPAAAGPGGRQARARASRHWPRPKHVTMTDRVSLPRAELVWPTVPARRPRRAGARRPGGGPRRARQGEPALPRPDVRPPARRAGRGRAPHAPPWRAVQRRRSTPSPARSSTSWSRSPTPRSSGSRPRGRPPTRSSRRRTPQESQLVVGAPVGRHARPTSSTATTSSSATRWPTRPRCDGSSPSRPADVKRVANKYLTASRVRLDVDPRPADAPRARGRRSIARAQAPLASPPVAAVKDTFDRSVMPKVGPTPEVHPAPAVARGRSRTAWRS